MQEQPDVGTVADGPEVVLALGLRLVIDFGGILNRQHVASADQAGGPLADGLNDLGHLHPCVVQKAPESGLTCTAVPQFTHA
jgi:hypothetical protein